MRRPIHPAHRPDRHRPCPLARAIAALDRMFGRRTPPSTIQPMDPRERELLARQRASREIRETPRKEAEQ